MACGYKTNAMKIEKKSEQNGVLQYTLRGYERNAT